MAVRPSSGAAAAPAVGIVRPRHCQFRASEMKPPIADQKERASQQKPMTNSSSEEISNSSARWSSKICRNCEPAMAVVASVRANSVTRVNSGRGPKRGGFSTVIAFPSRQAGLAPFARAPRTKAAIGASRAAGSSDWTSMTAGATAGEASGMFRRSSSQKSAGGSSVISAPG